MKDLSNIIFHSVAIDDSVSAMKPGFYKGSFKQKAAEVRKNMVTTELKERKK